MLSPICMLSPPPPQLVSRHFLLKYCNVCQDDDVKCVDSFHKTCPVVFYANNFQSVVLYEEINRIVEIITFSQHVIVPEIPLLGAGSFILSFCVILRYLTSFRKCNLFLFMASLQVTLSHVIAYETCGGIFSLSLVSVSLSHTQNHPWSVQGPIWKYSAPPLCQRWEATGNSIADCFYWRVFAFWYVGFGPGNVRIEIKRK